MLEAAEEIQDAAWTLRERGTGQDVYETLDRSAAGIYRACAAQDLTATQLEAMAKALRIVDQRLGALIDAWSVADVGVRGTRRPPSTARAPASALSCRRLRRRPQPLSAQRRRCAISALKARRQDPPGIAGLDAVKRQALFG